MGANQQNDFKIIKPIGKGGFGEVYLIQKENRYFVLKKINYLTNEEKVKYDTILKSLFKINNKHIIKYYNSFKQKNSLNIIMEYGGDTNLKQFIQKYNDKQQLIEEKTIKDIVTQICIGLKEIHRNNIIHRDLTPDNIFIDKNNRIKIGDFGISKILTDNNEYANSVAGKYNYWANEITNNEKYNNKIDIYSLGCVIYELFTLSEYYIDTKIEEKVGKINKEIYNPKWQELINLLLNDDYQKRPNIEEVLKFIDIELSDNYIIAEIDIKDEYVNKDIRIINSSEDSIRTKCNIKINDELISFNYFHKFKSKGKYRIKFLFKNLTKIDCLFAECELLTNIDLSNLNTQNINSMISMFKGCSSLNNINLSNLNTQNVKSMSGMFEGCSSLKSIDLSNFQTHNVIYMYCMFIECSSLVNVNLSSFNTENVIDMSGMFIGCSSLTNIVLSNFNTQNVTIPIQ